MASVLNQKYFTDETAAFAAATCCSATEDWARALVALALRKIAVAAEAAAKAIESLLAKEGFTAPPLVLCERCGHANKSC